MNDDERQQEFAERLRRIEERRAEARGGKAKSLRPTSLDPNFEYLPPKQDNRARNGVIWFSVAIMLGAGIFMGFQAIPEDLKNAVADLRTAEPSETAIAAAGALTTLVPQATETSQMSDQGPTLSTPLVATANGQPVTLIDVLTDINVTMGDSPVGEVQPFERNAQCNLRAASPREKIINVRIENALLTAPVQAFSNEELIDHLLRNVEEVTVEGGDYDDGARVSGQKTSLDVVVTDTSQPLYLVLQNMGPGVIWNIHPAPGVDIAHVAIISSGFSGLVAPPNDATFEGLLVRDFVTPHRFGADDEIRECMIRPWRLPADDWIGMIKAERGNTLYENQMATYTNGHRAFDAWYRGQLGVSANTNLVSARDAAHVLVGPIPEVPVSYRSMEGQVVHLMRSEHVITGNTMTRNARIDALHDGLLRAAVGGDLALLNPDPMVRSDQ